MKFITEDDLRTRYREAPFSEYPYQEGVRLTPGGRQFLVDRGVKIEEPQPQKSRHSRIKSGTQPAGTAAGSNGAVSGAADTASAQPETTEEQKARLALRTVAAVFLQAGVEIIAVNVLTAQELFAMEQYLTALLNGEEPREPLDSQSCTGLNPDNFKCNIGSCFAVTGFHAQTERGIEIVKFHYLRCLLQEQEPWLSGSCKEGVNCMINRLSQMICRALGGTVCQREN